MGISQIGVAAATASPTSASRPVFTLANTYDLSGTLSGVTFSANVIPDLVYDKGSGKLVFGLTDTTNANALAAWTLGTTTVQRYNLPTSIQTGAFKFLSGKSNRLWFSPGITGTYSIYSSTGGVSSTWETPFGSVARSDYALIGSNHSANLNTSDVVDFLETRNYALGANYLANYTTGSYYQIFNSGSASVTDNSGGSYARQKLTEIRSGDESNIINGYSYRAGSDIIDNANDGTWGVVSPRFYNLRSTNTMLFMTSAPPQIATYNRDGWIKGVAGRETCIENRWILNIGLNNFGDSLYDLVNNQFVPMSPLTGTDSSRVVYLSTTKKAYQWNKASYKMYEYDVTFI